MPHPKPESLAELGVENQHWKKQQEQLEAGGNFMSDLLTGEKTGRRVKEQQKIQKEELSDE